MDNNSLQIQIKYLKSLKAVRERSQKVYQKVSENQLQHFDVDLSKFADVVEFVISLTIRDYEDLNAIPPHGRWRHFDVGGSPRVQKLMDNWKATENDITPLEITRRILDLFVVSVLLDAGAGTTWSYTEKDTLLTFKRSEGLAIASLDMFKAGLFSSQTSQPYQVDAEKLVDINADIIATAFQVDPETNPLDGLEGRANLLSRLGKCLQNHPEFFPSDDNSPPRPGNMINYLLNHPTTRKTTDSIVQIDTLWSVIIDGFSDVWPPTRTSLGGVSLGDVWPCDVLRLADSTSDSTDHLVPFHKLSQWLTYSLMEPLTKILGIKFEGVQHLTGLPEYRNGGLFVDYGVLTLKSSDYERGLAYFESNALNLGKQLEEPVPMFEVNDPVIIEWRAVTVILLDLVHEQMRSQLQDDLILAQVLEAGTWKAGREVSSKKRPKTSGPPIAIKSDGTVF